MFAISFSIFFIKGLASKLLSKKISLLLQTSFLIDFLKLTSGSIFQAPQNGHFLGHPREVCII
jgi:hypothetical protein